MNTSVVLKGVVQLLVVVAVIASLPASLAGQELSICALVTAEDASNILGTAAVKMDPSGCGWTDATKKMRLNVAYVNVPSMFDAARVGTAKDGKTQDEPGLEHLPSRLFRPMSMATGLPSTVARAPRC
jgi:hypothetical protein